MTNLDVEVPRLESLVSGAGTLDKPAHDITFTGLQFSYATWLTPSSNIGYAEVQDGLTLTSTNQSVPQGTCTFGTPPGTCPYGALTRGPANVSFSAAHNITFSGNVFKHLGAQGLGFDYGSKHNLIDGNVFTSISVGALYLGNTNDPHGDVAPPGVQDTETNPVPLNPKEINEYNTISNNLIHDVGTDYPGAAGLTMFFTQHTNLIHDFMRELVDGGAIYIEGHQGQNLTHGLSLSGNVAYNQGALYNTWYNDANTQWISWTGNVEWHGYPYGGCQATGHLTYIGNYNSEPPGAWACGNPDFSDVHISDNVAMPPHAGAAELPQNILTNAGLTAPYRHLATAEAPRATYAQHPGGTNNRDVFVAGAGFSDNTRVAFAGTPASTSTVLNAGFLIATAPAGADMSHVAVTTPAGTVTAATVTGPDPSRGKPITNIGNGGCGGASGPDAMVDGDEATYFCTGKLPQSGDYIGVDLQTIQTIDTATVQMGVPGFLDDYMHNGVLEYSTEPPPGPVPAPSPTNPPSTQHSHPEPKPVTSDSAPPPPNPSGSAPPNSSSRSARRGCRRSPTSCRRARPKDRVVQNAWSTATPPPTFFTGKVPQSGDYIGVDLGSTKPILTATVNMATANFPNDYIHNGVLEYSSNGTTWTNAGTFTNQATVKATFPTGTQARYIRLRATATQSFWLRVPEFAVSVPAGA